MQIEKLLTTGKAAAILGCSPPTLRKLCRSGAIKYLKLGNRLLFPEESLKQFLNSITFDKQGGAN